MAAVSFQEFVKGLTGLRATGPEAATTAAQIQEAADAAEALIGLTPLNRGTLARLVRGHPRWVPFLATCIGLGQEQLKRQLQHRLGTSGWITLARTQPERLIEALDASFDLVRRIDEQRGQQWTFADVLVERAQWSQRSATGSIARGRRLEDVVEQALKILGLRYAMRTRFVGRGGETASCDFAIPEAGEAALIVGAVKGFDSTGSKLSDAVGEIQRMADVRKPIQFVFAFVDGIGWLGRKSDLKRIHKLWESGQIDGLYSLSRTDAFRHDLNRAAQRLGLQSRATTEG